MDYKLFHDNIDILGRIQNYVMDILHAIPRKQQFSWTVPSMLKIDFKHILSRMNEKHFLSLRQISCLWTHSMHSIVIYITMSPYVKVRNFLNSRTKNYFFYEFPKIENILTRLQCFNIEIYFRTTLFLRIEGLNEIISRYV